jgi:predicted TIM-barrel fold metal-dependent hydrolase
MDELDIEKALVWHISQYEYSPQEGNKLLSSLISGQDRLFGCWTILPPQTGEITQGEAFFKSMKEERIFALRVFPEEHRFFLNRVVFGKFLDEIVHRKIPLLLSLTRRGIDWPEIYDLLAEFPDLVCVLCDTSIWGTDRYFRPLLEKYNNVYIETSFLSLGDGVLEKLVCDYGAKRFLFGSAFPERIPEAAMLQLIHADIADSDKREIASKNLERLLTYET